MLLVHKQIPQFSLHSQHWRYPSAPASVVPAQRTPGLITLSKPIAKQQLPRQKQSPRPKSLKSSPKPVPAQEAVVALKRSPEIVEKKQSQPSPEKSRSRGRQPKSKDGNKSTVRSNSHSSVRSGRSRQPSPPLLVPSQAEVSSSPVRKSNLFDPFADDSIFRSSKPIRPAPTLASRPSGKLARRRHPISVPTNPTPANTPFNTPPRAIPVPRSSDSSSQLSRSVPIIHWRKPTSDVFPICDDLDDNDEDDNAVAFPTTPSRPRSAKNYDDGPRTAPITSSTVSFPFNMSSSPTPAPRRARKHRRIPSHQDVFHMSSDEEPTSSSSDPTAELKAFFDLFPNGRQAAGRPTATSFPDSQKERQIAAAAVAAAADPGNFFAGSAFQSSPSPEELPAPSFV